MTAAYSIAAPAGVAMKVCSKCGEFKPATTEFFPMEKWGLRSKCKSCRAAEGRAARIKREQLDPASEERRLAKARQYAEENREKIRQYKQVYRVAKSSAIAEYHRKRYLEKTDEYKARARRWKADNPDRRLANNRRWALENPESYRACSKRGKQKRRECPIRSLAERIRALVGISIRKNGYTKRTKTCQILGCQWDAFAAHIERQFLKGMTWENRDQWHIDHIIPLAAAKTEEDVIRLNHYTNLRPLWAKDNLRKGARTDFLI